MPIQHSVSVTSNSEMLAEQIKRGTQANLKAAAIIWHGGIVRQLTGSRSGRIYRIPGTSRRYTASAPGEAPATRTGDLRTSYRFKVYQKSAVVGSPLMYALHLEKGTSKMAPRPHIAPALVANRPAIMAALERNVI